MTRIDLTKFKAYAVAQCNGCGLYVARVERPPSYMFVMKYQAQDCTIILTDSIAMAGKRLQPCACKKGR